MAFITNFQSCVEIEDLIERYNFDRKTNIDKIFEDIQEKYTEWTVHKYSEIGETVYFMCAKTSIDHMRNLRKKILEFSGNEELFKFEDEQVEKYKSYAGKIIAVGKVDSEPFQADSGYSKPYWRSPWYASINEVKLLHRAIDISEFREFIRVSRTGAITKLNNKQEKCLNELILIRKGH